MPMDMHDNLSDADLKFLKKFGLLNDEDAQEAQPPADIPTDDDEAEVEEPQEEPVPVGPLDEGEVPAQPAEVEFEATMPEPAPDGKHVRDQEAEDEGIDMQEAQAVEEDTQEAQEAPQQAQEEPESGEGEDEPAEDPTPEDGPAEAPEAEEPEMDIDAERDQQDEHHPIAYDIEGNDIFVGSKVVSQADGNFVDADSEPYVAMVLGAWVGSANFANDNLTKRILIVERLGQDDGDSEMLTEDGRSGWAVQSNLTAVVVDEETDEPETEEEDPAEMDVEPEPEEQPAPEEEEDEREPKPDPPEARGQAYFLDGNGVELFDGDRVRVVSHQNFCDWPDEGIAEVVMAVRNGTENPALLPQNFEDPSLGSWKSYDGQPSFAIGWGNTLDGLVKYATEEPEPTPEPEQPEQPEEIEPPEDHPDVEPEPDEDQRKPLTKQQKDRFTNLATRIFTKAEGSFGKTKQTAEIGPLLPGGVFDGEEVAQVLEIRSNGVIYRITLSAERFE